MPRGSRRQSARSTMTRSLPEKTLEHWCSIHLTYRYRAKLLMWWPTMREDIAVRALRGVWGKQFWLELKTTEWNASARRHDLEINLGQLKAYGNHATPDYYVFPTPPWNGVLGDRASRKWLKVERERLAYETHSDAQWFTQWTHVVPGAVLRRNLRKELRSVKAGVKTPLRIAEIKGGVLQPIGPALVGAPTLPWRSFWAYMDACGDDVWTSEFIVPRGTVRSRTAGIPRNQLVAALRLAREEKRTPAPDETGDFFSPTADLFQRNMNTVVPEDFDWDGPTRTLATITHEALRG